MRVMAHLAALGLDRRVWVNERTGGLRMAFHAHYVTAETAAQHGPRALQGALERAVRIMAVAARHQPFIHLVMKRLSKRRLDIGVAGIAELRLRYFKKACLAPKFMDAVTV